MEYPLSENPKDYYLIIDINKTAEFGNRNWKFKELAQYKAILDTEKNHRIALGLPFTVSLTELMKIIQVY